MKVPPYVINGALGTLMSCFAVAMLSGKHPKIALILAVVPLMGIAAVIAGIYYANKKDNE